MERSEAEFCEIGRVTVQANPSGNLDSLTLRVLEVPGDLPKFPTGCVLVVVHGARKAGTIMGVELAQTIVNGRRRLHNHSAVILVRCYSPDISDSDGETQGSIIAMQNPVSEAPGRRRQKER